MRTALLLIHILAAGTWFGTNVVQFAVNPRIASYPKDIGVWWMRRVVWFGTRIYMPVSVVLLLTGVFLVVDSSVYSFSTGFVGVGFAAVVVAALLGSLVFGPRGEAMASAIEAGDDAQVRRLSTSTAAFGVLDTALIAVAVLAMVAKWGV